MFAVPPPAVPASGDVDSFTKMLLHFTGTPGGIGSSGTGWWDSSMLDRSPAGWSSGVDITAATFAYGPTSLFLTAPAWIGFPDSADWEPGSGDYTVDCWVRATGGTGSRRFIYGHCDPAGGASLANLGIGLEFTDTNKLRGYMASPSANNAIIGTTTVNTDTWYHVAQTKEGNQHKIWLNGNLEAQATIVGTLSTPAYELAIGRLGEYNGFYWPGYVDEFRVSKGIARWTANFTPKGPYS